MKAKKERILLVEDDVNFGLVLKNYLELDGFQVVLSPDGSSGWRDFNHKGPFSLCILDIMMPYKDGFTLGREIKNADKDIPLIFLTAKALKEDQLIGYRIGADDYVIKPFDSELLLHKIKAILKRNDNSGQRSEPDKYKIGLLDFNYDLREISHNGHVAVLSPKEAQLLKLLCEHINGVTPRDEALLKIWKEDNYFTGRSMDVYITKLRKYLLLDPAVKITNVHGSGFCLSVEENKEI